MQIDRQKAQHILNVRGNKAKTSGGAKSRTGIRLNALLPKIRPVRFMAVSSNMEQGYEAFAFACISSFLYSYSCSSACE